MKELPKVFLKVFRRKKRTTVCDFTDFSKCHCFHHRFTAFIIGLQLSS